MKVTRQLPDDCEYAIVVWGQSNARPRGLMSELVSGEPEMALPRAGLDVWIASETNGSAVRTLVSVTSPGVGTLPGVDANTRPGQNELAGGKLVMAAPLFTKPRPAAAQMLRGGAQTIISNTTTTITTDTNATLDFPSADPITPPNTPVTGFIDWTQANHGLQIDDVFVILTNPPANFTANTPYYVIAATPTTFQLAATPRGEGIGTTATPSLTPTAAAYKRVYAVKADSTARKATMVRMLTPTVIPVEGAHLAAFPDLACRWLDYTPCEGRHGYGTGNLATGLVGGVSSTEVTLAGDPWPQVTDFYKGGQIDVVTLDGTRYTAAVTANTYTPPAGPVPGFATITVSATSWYPSVPPASVVLTSFAVLWHPHHADNPHLKRLSPWFGYPNDDMQPGGSPVTNPNSSGALYDAPVQDSVTVNTTTPAYTSLDAAATWAPGNLPIVEHFSWVYALAWRLASKLGKRINVIHLGIDSASLYPSEREIFEVRDVPRGWFNHRKSSWSPSLPASLAARLDSLLSTGVTNANAAETDPKPVRVIGIFGVQGETDALSATGRAAYGTALRQFYSWLRRRIEFHGLSAYSSEVEIPVTHLTIDETLAAALGDTNLAVNAGINTLQTFPFAEPSTGDIELNLLDPFHYTGAGHIALASLFDTTINQLMEDAAAGSLDLGGAVDICNLALSHIGETPNVTAIDPPDGSVNSVLCAQFFPRARDNLLELAAWKFASRRATLIEVDNDTSAWLYAYALPDDMLTASTVQDASAADDYALLQDSATVLIDQGSIMRTSSAQPFVIERRADGDYVLRTNQADAVLRYTARINTIAEYPHLLRMALSWSLASMLAGARIKGTEGAAQAQNCLKMMQGYLAAATTHDGSQRKVPAPHSVPWIEGR